MRVAARLGPAVACSTHQPSTQHQPSKHLRINAGVHGRMLPDAWAPHATCDACCARPYHAQLQRVATPHSPPAPEPAWVKGWDAHLRTFSRATLRSHCSMPGRKVTAPPPCAGCQVSRVCAACGRALCEGRAGSGGPWSLFRPRTVPAVHVQVKVELRHLHKCHLRAAGSAA